MAPPSSPAAPQKKQVRTLQDVLSDGVAEKKLLILGPGPTEKLQDSRIGLGEAHGDHVVVKLLGEEQLIVPYSSILTVKVDRTQITLRLR